MRLDLHRHLEGSHSARALAHVARTFDIRDPLFLDADGKRFLEPHELAPTLAMSGPSDDGAVFYACIEKARRAYVSRAAIAELALQAFLDAAKEADGLEMRISLFSMTRTLLGKQWREVAPEKFAEEAERVLAGVLSARDSAVAQSGRPMLVRVGFSRTFESADHYRAMAQMLAGHARAVCGLDVLGILPSGDKEPLQPELVAIMEELRKSIPDLTIHAGEFMDHQSVERALALRPRGIGHGVHSVQSAAVMERLAREGVTLEVCPTSNALLIEGAVKKLRALHGGRHPLCTLQHNHVHAVLGSDDPVAMGTSFPREWEIAQAEGVDLQRLEQDMERRWRELTGTVPSAA